MSKTTLENLLEMLERSNSKKKTVDKTADKTAETQTLSVEPSSPETPGTLTLGAVNDKLEGFGQQIGALLASVQQLHEKVDVLGKQTHASDADQPEREHTVRYETDDVEAAGVPDEQDPDEPDESDEQEPDETDEQEPDEQEPDEPDEQDSVVPYKPPPVQTEWQVLTEPAPESASESAPEPAPATPVSASPLASASPRVLIGRIPGRKSVCMLSPDCLVDLLPVAEVYSAPDSVPASPISEPESLVLADPAVLEVTPEHDAPASVLETHAEETDTYTNATDVAVDMNREESYIVRIRDEAELLAQIE